VLITGPCLILYGVIRCFTLPALSLPSSLARTVPIKRIQRFSHTADNAILVSWSILDVLAMIYVEFTFFDYRDCFSRLWIFPDKAIAVESSSASIVKNEPASRTDR
jgi:hypothetical protein